MKKIKAEKDQWKDAAKHRQAVANASEQLVESFKLFTTSPTNPENVTTIVKEKKAAMKNEIMQVIGW
jgi:hypothetical protein